MSFSSSSIYSSFAFSHSYSPFFFFFSSSFYRLCVSFLHAFCCDTRILHFGYKGHV